MLCLASLSLFLTLTLLALAIEGPRSNKDMDLSFQRYGSFGTVRSDLLLLTPLDATTVCVCVFPFDPALLVLVWGRRQRLGFAWGHPPCGFGGQRARDLESFDWLVVVANGVRIRKPGFY